MKVVIVEPGKAPRIADIDNDLETLQGLVGGYIETISPFKDDVVLIVNEEGKLKGLPLCRTLADFDHDKIDDLVGTIVIAGTDPDEGEFRGLTDKQAERFRSRFEWSTIVLE